MIEKKKFATVALDPNYEAFVDYIAFISQHSDVRFFSKALMVFFKTNETHISIIFKYNDFADIFSQNLVAKLTKHIRIYDFAINFIEKH